MDRQTDDIITAMTANESFLFVGRMSGTIMKFTLPHISSEPKYFVQCRPNLLYVNCNSTRLISLDLNGSLILLDLEPSGGKQLEYEKKECWAVVWSDTDPLSFAVMEKSRLHIVRGVTADDPITSDAYIC